MDLISFAVARSQATNKGLADADSNRIGLLGALMPNPITALVIGRSLADRETPPPVVVPPPDGDPPRTTLDEVAQKADEAQSTADKAAEAATTAAQAAEDVKKAVADLGTEVKEGFHQVSKRLDALEAGKVVTTLKPKGGATE